MAPKALQRDSSLVISSLEIHSESGGAITNQISGTSIGSIDLFFNLHEREVLVIFYGENTPEKHDDGECGIEV